MDHLQKVMKSVTLRMQSIRNACKTQQFVIPGKRSATRNPVIKELVPRLRGDDAWIPAFAGMTNCLDLFLI
ncbi:MAG: hypothetical protein LLG40_13690 [Deltaproteobacteria bacterium]|nr:hypothetical protein [Deltaproteobacteria bacterium]